MKKLHLIILFLLASCSTTIKDFDKYEKEFISKTSFMPSPENVKGMQPKVVVFEFEENNNDTAKNANLGKAIGNNIENILTKNRLIELVDRSAAEKLKKEIALSEINKTGSYKGPKIADYAISGAISNADFSSKYTSGSTYVNPKNLQVITIPPKYTYSSKVSGNIKIYELPSLTVVENIEFFGSKSRSENVRQNGGVSLGGLQIGGEKVDGIARDDGLVRSAAYDAIENSKVELKNTFAKKGYILEKRAFKDKVIFKISLGSQDGIKQENEFEIISKFEVENPLTNEVEIERRIIATGKVSNLINPQYSWVVINEKNKAKSIRLGDVVKIKYKRSAIEKFIKDAQKLSI